MTSTYRDLADKSIMFNLLFYLSTKNIDLNNEAALRSTVTKFTKKQMKLLFKNRDSYLEYNAHKFTNADLTILKSNDIIKIFNLLYFSQIKYRELLKIVEDKNIALLSEAELTEDTMDEFLGIFYYNMDVMPLIIENDIHLPINETFAYTTKIIFKNVELIKNSFTSYGTVENLEILKKANKLVFQFDFTDFKTESPLAKRIEFACEEIISQTTLYNYQYCPTNFSDKNYLASSFRNMVYSILKKHTNLKSIELTLKEKEMLPICCALFPQNSFLNNQEDNWVTLQKEGLENLINISNKIGDVSFTGILKKQRTNKPINTEYLIDTLFTVSHKNLALYLLNKLKECANEFQIKPINIKGMDEKELYQKEITKILYSCGFHGKYPHFKRMGTLKGIHTVTSNFNPYFIYNEKYMASYIDCVETETCGYYHIHLLTGTIFLRKDEVDNFESFTALDACFSNKWRNTSKVIKLGSHYSTNEENITGILNFLTNSTRLAAKIATFEKLDKRDKQLLKLQENPSIPFKLTLAILLGMAVFFGLFMFIGMGLLEFILGLLISHSLSEAIKLCSESFFLLFRICMTGGLAFGVLTLPLILIGRKN